MGAESIEDYTQTKSVLMRLYASGTFSAKQAHDRLGPASLAASLLTNSERVLLLNPSDTRLSNITFVSGLRHQRNAFPKRYAPTITIHPAKTQH